MHDSTDVYECCDAGSVSALTAGAGHVGADLTGVYRTDDFTVDRSLKRSVCNV